MYRVTGRLDGDGRSARQPCIGLKIVDSFAGPESFNGTGYQVLNNVSIGQEGRIDLEFKADDPGGNGYLWYLSDNPATETG